MSVESEILRIQHNIADAYTKVAEKGGEVPLQPTSANLAAAIASIPAGSSGEIYSTEETRIGTWIDGKPLYRKVYNWFGSYAMNTSRTYQRIGSIPENMDLVVYCFGNQHTRSPLPSTTFIPYADGGAGSFATFDIFNGYIDDITRWSGSAVVDQIIAILLYTKTTDQATARTLSKAEDSKNNSDFALNLPQQSVTFSPVTISSITQEEE